MDECVEGPFEAPKERGRVCFAGFRPTKHVEEPRALARGGSTAEDAFSLSPREGVKKSVSSVFYAQQGVDRFPNFTIAKS